MPPKRARRGKPKSKRRPEPAPEVKPEVDEDAFQPLTAAELHEHSERLELLKRMPKADLLRMINTSLFPKVKLASFKGMSTEDLAPALVKVALSETHKASVRVPTLQQLADKERDRERTSNAQAHLIREAGLSSYTADDGTVELAKAGEQAMAKTRLESQASRAAKRLRALKGEPEEEEEDD